MSCLFTVKSTSIIKRTICQQAKANTVISPEKVLSQRNKNNCIKLLKSMRSMKIKNPTKSKKAAVLVPLCQVGEELGLLYTVRAPQLKVNGGQVSFPGGMQDNIDKNLEETALRETSEEIGVPSEKVDIWEHGPEIYRPDLTVTPFLGYIGNINVNDLVVNSTEVSMVFIATLKHLSNSENFSSTQFRMGKTHVYTTPVYFTPQKRIWGLTAMVTHSFLSALIPDVYNYNIKFKPVYRKIYGINYTNKNLDEPDKKSK